MAKIDILQPSIIFRRRFAQNRDGKKKKGEGELSVDLVERKGKEKGGAFDGKPIRI